MYKNVFIELFQLCIVSYYYNNIIKSIEFENNLFMNCKIYKISLKIFTILTVLDNNKKNLQQCIFRVLIKFLF